MLVFLVSEEPPSRALTLYQQGLHHFPPQQKKWSTTELETYTVVWALKTFKHYLASFSTLLKTDHNPLLWLRSHAE